MTTASAVANRGARVLAWSPLLAAAVYLFVLAGEFSRFVSAVYWNSDLAFIPVLAESFPPFSGRRVVVGPNNSSTTLWFDLLTRPLPFHRQIWQAAPFVLALCGLLLLVWSAWRISGRWSAMLTFAIGISTAPVVLVSLVAQSLHVTTWFVDSLLAAFLVFLATRAAVSRGTVVAGSVVAVVAGTNVASDPLLLFSGLVPFLAAPVLVALKSRRRRDGVVAVVAAATVAGSLAVALLTAVAIRHAGFSVTTRFLGATGEPGFATPSEAWKNLGALFSNVLAMSNGSFFGLRLSVAALASFACAVFALVALGWLLVAGGRWLRTDHTEASSAPTPLMLYLLFWVVTVATIPALFVFSNAPVGDATGRYLIPLFYAIAASVPLLASPSALGRVVAVVGTLVLSVMSTKAVARAELAKVTEQVPIVQQASAIRSLLNDRGLTRGYAGYWTAHAFTWKSAGKQDVFPVWECTTTGSRSLCPFPANRADQWYVPRPGVRTFLIVDHAAPPPLLIDPPPERFGPPDSFHRFGPITVFVYGYDIARAFGG